MRLVEGSREGEGGIRVIGRQEESKGERGSLGESGGRNGKIG